MPKRSACEKNIATKRCRENKVPGGTQAPLHTSMGLVSKKSRKRGDGAIYQRKIKCIFQRARRRSFSPAPPPTPAVVGQRNPAALPLVEMVPAAIPSVSRKANLLANEQHSTASAAMSAICQSKKYVGPRVCRWSRHCVTAGTHIPRT